MSVELSLGAKQALFSRLMVKLLSHMHEQGYETRLGHTYRCEQCPVGRRRSCHKLKLAIDIHLFFNERYLTKTQDHQAFGEYWEALHPLCSWGGRFNDGNHYSLRHAGLR